MKTITVIIRKMFQPAILAVLGLTLVASTGQSAEIEMWVKTGGQWVLLVPGSNTGGRVVYNASYRCYITDRASRGERMEVDFYPSTYAEWMNSCIYRCWISSQGGSMTIYGDSSELSSTAAFQVPTSPSWDNNYVNIRTVSGRFSKRIPVGTRP